MIVGLSNGGDLAAPARSALLAAGFGFSTVHNYAKFAAYSSLRAAEHANDLVQRTIPFTVIAAEEFNQSLREATGELRDALYGVQNVLPALNRRLQELDDARRKLQGLIAKADRIQQEREIFRQRGAAVVQGFRTRDAAFRIFRNEKLERYKILFDLASQYAFMAAQTFDYETGLLHTDAGQEFISRIVQSRALGVVQNGEPQFAGSNTGDPGLSGALAEMAADFEVLRGRLGFNNPDGYGTAVSLRTENFRILPRGTNSVPNAQDMGWADVLNRGRVEDLLEDSDVRRYCLQIDAGDGQPVPGIVVEFSTVIADGLNVFGRPLAPGDHAYSVSSFATKLFAVGVALDGYQGMDDPAANAAAVQAAGGSSTTSPSLSFLDPNGLAATPYIYLIPVGLDSMRSPPLGDVSVIRSWSVDDVSIPLPFNIGASEFSNAQLWQSRASLSEDLFSIRKHQAFRPVSSTSLFEGSIYRGSSLAPLRFTNSRLIGRSVWNSRWKLVIPGKTLLNDPKEGLDRFIRTVDDIHLYFVTYSYSGN